MKILDRYILVSFLKNYVISFLVLIGLYIVLDMVFNFDEFAVTTREAAQQAGGAEGTLALLREIADFYFYQSFLIFAHLAGVIPVVAAAFTLIRLQRFNETTASLAAGVPLLRTAMPIILAAVVLNVLLVVDQEVVIPHMIPKLTRKHDELQQTAKRTYPIRAMQDNENGLVNAARYHPATEQEQPWMECFDVITHDDNFMPVSHTLADRADWEPRTRQWRLTNGRRVDGLRPGDKRTDDPCDIYKSSVTPDEIALYRSGEFVELLSTSKIDQLLERPKSYGTLDLQRVKHMRFTMPLLNVVLLLLAVGSVLTREPGRLRQGILQCGILVGAAMAAVFVAQQLAGTPPGGSTLTDRWPAIMAWVPILIFGPVAVWLLDRVKT